MSIAMSLSVLKMRPFFEKNRTMLPPKQASVVGRSRISKLKRDLPRF